MRNYSFPTVVIHDLIVFHFSGSDLAAVKRFLRLQCRAVPIIVVLVKLCHIIQNNIPYYSKILEGIGDDGGNEKRKK